MTTTALPTSTGSNSDKSSRKPGFLESRRQKEEDKKLASWVNEEYNKCKRARTQLETRWYRNMMLYAGDQWVVTRRDGLSGQARLVTPKAPPWRTRLTVNRIRPIIRTELARTVSQRPNASVVPASSDDDDLFAAQAGEQVWESSYYRLKVNRKLRSSMWWTLITGNGYLKIYWDSQAVDKRNNVNGDYCIEALTPFHVFVPDQTLEDIEDQPYVIHAKVVPVSTLKQQYPDHEFNANIKSTNEIIDNVRQRVDTNAQPDSCMMLEMWLKPGAHKDYPEGGLIRVVDTIVVVNEKKMPYDHGEFPFIKFDHIPTGKYYTDSVIVDLDPLQLEYNRTRSQIVESKNRMAKPQLVAPEGSVDPSKMTTEPGQVILYKPGFAPPTPLPLQSLPPYVLQEQDRIIGDMEDISAQHQVSKGNAPPGVTAATAINFLQEKDDSVLSHTYSSVEEGMEKLARHVLTLAVQYWDVKRTIRVTGTDGAFDALALKGADLKNATDIRMEAGSALPTSKAARQAFIMDLMKMGFVEPSKGLELMEMGGVQKLYEQLKVDERQAQRENLRMKETAPAAIAQHKQMTDMVNQIIGGFQQQVQEQSSVIPPELAGDLMPRPGQNDGGNLSLAGADPNQVPDIPGVQKDAQTGQPLVPPPLVPVNTWDNHAVHIDVHNRFRKTQSFELLPPEVKDLFEEHVNLHKQAQMEAQMQMGGMPGMGVPDPAAMQMGGEQMPPPDMGGQMPPTTMG